MFQIKPTGPAMTITSFKDMYLAELQELLSVEVLLADELLSMAGNGHASVAEAGADPSSRRNRDRGAANHNHSEKAWCRRNRTYRPGDAGADC
jgi:hypothetical protein